MSNKLFDNFGAFREWANLDSGDVLVFPFGSSKGWSVFVKEGGVEISSPFYRVAPGGAHGAAMIHGHTFSYGGYEISGIVEFGLMDNLVVVTNRRRVTSTDTFDENTHEFVGVIVAQPDRCLESVAVVVNKTSIDKTRSITAEQRLALYDRVQDGLELTAVRELFRWVDAN